MSKIKDYLSIVTKGIKNGDKVIEALIVSAKVKNGKINNEALAEILRRKEICASCPYNSENAKRDRGYNSNIPYQHCILCSCRIGGEDTKEYCLSCNCGISELNKRNVGLPLPLKWEAFEVK